MVKKWLLCLYLFSFTSLGVAHAGSGCSNTADGSPLFTPDGNMLCNIEYTQEVNIAFVKNVVFKSNINIDANSLLTMIQVEEIKIPTQNVEVVVGLRSGQAVPLLISISAKFIKDGSQDICETKILGFEPGVMSLTAPTLPGLNVILDGVRRAVNTNTDIKAKVVAQVNKLLVEKVRTYFNCN
ncbi:MAG: hypothetical protein HQK52_23035 [Oligoflexia bacterium]|nr:hypothetical protein [Oligoflexia bacterium]